MTDSESTTRKCQSWIDQFCELTNGIPSPEIFRTWAAIGAISAALERRCWTAPNGTPLYPNLCIFLVGRPGVGKTQSLSQALNIIHSVSEIKVAPDDSTKAALVDFLAEDARKRITLAGELHEYNSIFACAHELGVLIKEHDLEFLSFLSSLYDSPDMHEERRRGRKENPLLRIIRPSITFVAGTTPGYLSSVFPEAAWSQGFMARTICVYSSHVVKPPLFGQRVNNTKLQKDLIQDLSAITKLQGEFTWTAEAENLISTWYNDNCPPIPTHSRLANYATRRPIQALKLCMIFSAAQSNSMEITADHVTSALDLLLSAEAVMPEIFLEMSSNSDANVISQLHFYAMKQYLQNGSKPIHKSRILYFLGQYVPTWRAQSILDYCLDARIFSAAPSNPDAVIPVANAMQGGKL